MYNKKIMKLFKEQKNAGKLKNPDGIGEVINETCGDSMRVYIKVKNNKISDIKIETMGCVAAIASSEALAYLVNRYSFKDALMINNLDILKFLVGDIPAPKIHCSLLAQSALKKAIEDYNGKI